MRFHPWANYTTLGLGMAILALTPGQALEVLRWVAFVATGVVLVRAVLKRRQVRPDATAASRPEGGASRLSAVLLVETEGGLHAQLSAVERAQVLEAITRSVRVGDTVSMDDGGTFTVRLEGVTPALAKQVGDRICDQVKDLIVFDRFGRLVAVPVAIGGVIGAADRDGLPLGVARENLVRARDLEGQKLLISSAA